MRSKYLLVSFVCLASAAFVACGGDDDDNKSNVAGSANALIQPVEKAFTQPTGTLDASKAPKVFDSLRNSDVTKKASEYMPSDGDGGGGSCFTASAAGGSVDLSCASSGEVSGTMNWQTQVEGGQTASVVYYTFNYSNVCADGVCVTGAGAQKMNNTQEGMNMTFAGNFDVTEGGATHKVEYGFKMSMATIMTMEYVVFLDGESYVVSWEFDQSTMQGSYSVKGANGEYDCTASFEEAAWVGSCSGAADFEF